jgi:DNA-binding NarL/FixJ family response regulator
MMLPGTSDEKSRPMCDLNATIRTTTVRDDNGVALAASLDDESDIANILIVEHDADCADALETILADLPGIATVQTAATAGDAFDLLNDGEYDVVGFGMLPAVAPAATPDVIFIGAHQPDSNDVALELLDTLTTLRARVPDASIVLLCVYPSQYRDALDGLVDGCIRKDTSARELRALIDDLRATRSAA